MCKTDRDKLAEIMLGEAVLRLLSSSKGIGWAQVIESLETLAVSEIDEQRRAASKRAINDVVQAAASGAPDALLKLVEPKFVAHVPEVNADKKDTH